MRHCDVKRRSWQGFILTLSLFLTLVWMGTRPATAQEWRSALYGRGHLIIETKAGSTLPAEVLAQLSADTVQYPSFTVSYPEHGRAEALIETAEEWGLIYQYAFDTAIDLGGTRLSLDQLDQRDLAWSEAGVFARVVPERYLIQFAYPLRQAWLDELGACGMSVAAVISSRSLLVRAADLKTLTECPTAHYLTWIDPFLTTDRLTPDIFAEPAADSFWLLHSDETRLEEVAAALPPAAEVLDSYRTNDGLLSVRVAADHQALLQLIDESPTLLSVSPHGEAAPSDERQSKIVADGFVPALPGYIPFFLQPNGLTTPAHQQTVAVFDTGIDGSHPDFQSRILSGIVAVGDSITDPVGHGTMVAGIVAGNGNGTGRADAAGYLYGTGIGPHASVVPVKIFVYNDSCALEEDTTLAELGEAFSASRSYPNGSERAAISNHSWNKFFNTYDTTARLFDERVIDADAVHAGAQPMTVVVSAGNRTSCSFGDCVLSPATAKNVITVGATENLRPSSDSTEPPLVCAGWPPALIQDGVNINRTADFSARGKMFFPWPGPLVHTVRVKPDLVAPGVRVFSTAPSDYDCSILCADYFPASQSFHSYAQGTSFAAPAVSGAAALFRKWLLDRGSDAAPSLVKASLIATATDIGFDPSYAGDHRPSNVFGWGRVELDRLVNSQLDRFFVNESTPLALATGEERTFTVSVSDASEDVAIVLAWSDPPSTIGGSQVPLINDLRLIVDEESSTAFWRGNNFRENQEGIDDGYSYRFTSGDPFFDDQINTVETVFIPGGTLPAGERLTVRVVGASIASGPQRFALYVDNAQVELPTTPGPPIFEDSFEGGDLSAWGSQWAPAGSALAVTEGAAMSGSRGLEVRITANPSNVFLTDATPQIENHYQASFLFDPTSLTMAEGNAFALFAGLNPGNGPYNVQLRLRRSGGVYQLRLDGWDDNGTVASTPAWSTITNDLHHIALEWWAATVPGVADGGIRLRIDGQLAGERTDLDNDERVIDRVRFGALGLQSGTAGTFYLDDFRSWSGSRHRTVISSADFDDGVLPWPATVSGGGAVAVSTGAALSGSHGLDVAIVSGSTQVLATDAAPQNESSYNAYFRFDPNTLTMALDANHVIFLAADTTGWTADVRLRLSPSGTYQLRSITFLDNGTSVVTPWVAISDGPTRVRLEWRAATVQASGRLRLWVDGQLASDLGNLANGQKRVQEARIGAVAGLDAGTAGSCFFDDFRSWKTPPSFQP